MVVMPSRLMAKSLQRLLTEQMDGATSFSYDLRLFLDTSFTGEDLLRNSSPFR